MKKNILYIATMAITMAACNNDDMPFDGSQGQQRTPARVQVTTVDNPQARSIITATGFADGECIGIGVTDVSGGNYEDMDYSNVPYTSSGTGNSQTWTADEPVMLSMEPANIYAYYPYSNQITDIKKIPVSTETQTDWLYALPATALNAQQADATLVMRHAMAAVRVSIVKGTYEGTAQWTETTMNSDGAATSATLDAMTGELSDSKNAGASITATQDDLTLSTTDASSCYLLAVPTGSAAALDITVTVDGKQYTTRTEEVTLQQGKIHTVTLTLNKYDLVVNKVSVTPWNDTVQQDTTVDLGYQLHIGGNTDGIAFSTSVTDGKAVITCVPIDRSNIIAWPTLEGEGTMKINDDFTTGKLTVAVSDLKADATLSFNGLDNNVILAIHQTTADNQAVRIVGDGYSLNNVRWIGIDGDNAAIGATYTFPKAGTHYVRMALVPGVKTWKVLFKNCKHLVDLDVSNYDFSEVTNIHDTFLGCTALKRLDTSSWQTSQLTDVGAAFYNCTALEEIVGIEDWDMSNVTCMHALFKECKSIKRLDLSKWDTSNWTGIEGSEKPGINDMFLSCEALEYLDVSTWDVSKVLNFARTFYNCKSLTTLDVSNWNTQSAQGSMAEMFRKCNKIKTLNVSNFKTDNVTNMSYMFEECYELEQIYGLDNFNTSNVTSMSAMFNCCRNLTELNVSNFNTANVTNMQSMFDNCYAVKTLDVSHFNTSKVTNMACMFRYCKALDGLNVSDWDVSKVLNSGRMFLECNVLTTLDVENWKFPLNEHTEYMFNGCGLLEKLDVSNWLTGQVKNMYFMFNGCKSLNTIDVSGWDTSNVTDMGGMFSYGCAVTELDCSGWNTSNVTNMSNMFRDATKLTKLNVSGWNTSKVTNIMEMFRNTAIEELDLSHFDVSNVETGHFLFLGSGKLKKLNVDGWKFTKLKRFSNMFESCISLAELNIKDWDTLAATDMGNMFHNCSSLTSLDLSSFDTSNVTCMGLMFSGCSKLTSLDISSFDTSNVTDMKEMFSVCGALPTFTFKNFDTTKVTTMKAMFYHCRCLSDDVLNSLKFNMASCSDISWMFYNAYGIQNYNLSNWNIQPGTNMANMFNGTAGIKTITFKDNLEGCNVTDIFKGQTGQVTLSYNSAYNYSNIIAQLPTTWTAVPVNY